MTALWLKFFLSNCFMKYATHALDYLESVSHISRNNWIKISLNQSALCRPKGLTFLTRYFVIHLLYNNWLIQSRIIWFRHSSVRICCFQPRTVASNNYYRGFQKVTENKIFFNNWIRVSTLIPRLLLVKFKQMLKRFVFEVCCEIWHYYTWCFYHVTYAFRLNLLSVIAWISRNFLLETGAISEI